MLRSLRCVINCSKQHFIPHIQQWDADSTVDISPWILSGITPAQSHLLYKAPGEIIFPHFTSLRTLQKSQTLKPSRFSKLPNFPSPFLKESLNLLKVQGSIYVLILISFYLLKLSSSRPIFLAFYSLFSFLKKKILLHPFSSPRWVGLNTS